MIEKIFGFAKPFFEKISKNKKVLFIMLLGLSGMLLIALSSFNSKEPCVKTEPKENMQNGYSEDIEKSLADFLGNIASVGNVRVMITFDTGTETVYAEDTDEHSSKSQDEKEEIKISREHIIIKNGGNESGLEIKEIYPKVRGVAVICDGGNNPVIKEQITSILCALFNINSTQISVAGMAK